MNASTLDVLSKIAAIVHDGGLARLSEADALSAIRRLTIAHWTTQNGTMETRRDAVLLASQERDAIDMDNGFRHYPWTYTNQPGNVGAWALGGCARRARPGGDPIDHGLSLLQELHAKGLGIVRVPKLPIPGPQR